jgi:uncharacterized protein (DUF58 family)
MPTRAGWTAVVAAAGLISAGRVVGLLELYGFGAVLLIALFAGLITVRRPLGHLSVTRLIDPPEVECGDTARATLTITNRSRWRSPWLRLWEPVGHDAGAPMRIAPLRAAAEADATYRIPTEQRGIVELGPLRVERADHFGLATSGEFVGESHEVLVFPRRIRVPFPHLDSAGPIGQQLRLRSFATSGSEFHSQREYVPGDDLRRINWKASARSTELIVREVAREGLTRCTIALDLDQHSYHTGDMFELAVSIAASVASAATLAGLPVHTVAHGIDLEGADAAPRTMRWLATAESVPSAAAPALGPHGEGLSLLAAIGGERSQSFVDALRRQAGPDDIMVVLQAGIEMVDLEQFAALWSGWVNG